MTRLPLTLLAAALALAGCVSTTENPQSPTPTEQLLPSHAAEAACSRLDLRLARGTRAVLLVDAGGETAAGKYLAAACTAHLGGRGVDLVEDRAHADVLIRLRISAAGIEDSSRTWGLASVTIPAVPGSGLKSPTTTPALSVYSQHARAGVAELYASAFAISDGRLIAAVGPIAETTTLHSGSLLTGISLGSQVATPGVMPR